MRKAFIGGGMNSGQTPQEVIAGLRDPLIDSLITPCHSDIDTVASFLGIDEGYLSVQVRLLLPQFSQDEMTGRDATSLVRDVLRTLRTELSDFETHYKAHRVRNGIDELSPGLKLKGKVEGLRLVGVGEDVPIRFGDVDSEDGDEIQNAIHYIHQARADTMLHSGLFVAGRDFPLCYCAVSPCDREYQRAALSESLDRDIPLESIAVMTRAYGYAPLPKNMMSKLFDLTAHRLRSEGQFEYIITALNPLLGFNGVIFLAASYVPFARSPLVYRYTDEGLYGNRRNESATVHQRYATPPIIWLVNPLRDRLPDGPWRGKIVDVDPGDYSNG